MSEGSTYHLLVNFLGEHADDFGDAVGELGAPLDVLLHLFSFEDAQVGDLEHHGLSLHVLGKVVTLADLFYGVLGQLCRALAVL